MLDRQGIVMNLKKLRRLLSGGEADGAQMVPGDKGRMELHRPRQADANRLRRKLQRQLPRRVPERDAVLAARSGPRRHHCMEGGSQQEQTAFIARQYHAQRVRTENGYGKAGRMRPD